MYFQLQLISGRTGMYGRMRKGNGGKKRAHLKTDGNCSNRLSGRKESATSGTFAECRGAEVVRGEVQMGGSVEKSYFRRSFHFPFPLRLLTHQPRVNGKKQQQQQYIVYRVHSLKTPSPSAPTIIKR